MKRSAVFATFVAAVALAVGGCSDPQQGKAAPADGAAPPASSAQSSPNGGSPTATINPCSLLSPAELAQFATFDAPYIDSKTGGSRPCDWRTTLGTKPERVIGVAVWDNAGIDQMNDVGAGKQSGQVNGRSAVLVPMRGGGCILGLAVTPSSRVDVGVTADPGNSQQACDIASKVANIVEPKLPKG